jgi:hypothetical protein
MSNILQEVIKHAPPDLLPKFDQLLACRQKLFEHPVYNSIETEAQLRIFMERHVFAVWDFMSLVKKLQQIYTCSHIPWFIPSNPVAARLINQIVLDEESDLDKDGNPSSHLELYLMSMKDIGCNTTSFIDFIWSLRCGDSLSDSLLKADAPYYVARFVKTSMFGREDPIPQLFWNIMNSDLMKPLLSENLAHYLERHVHVDAQEHAPAAAEVLITTLGRSNTAWEIALDAGKLAISERIALWDGIYAELVAAGGDTPSSMETLSS